MENNLNICFYYQVWHTNQLSTFEALKQLRKIYPLKEIVLVIAGLKKENLIDYDKNFTSIVKNYFNISNTDYMFIDDYPYMNKASLKIPDLNIIRDEYTKFAHAWIDQFVSLPSKNTDIVVSCSDDWIPFKKIPFDASIDVCGRITGTGDWMNLIELNKFIKMEKPCWIQHGHYMNYKKLQKYYIKENKDFIEKVIKNIYSKDQPMFLDWVFAIWNSLIFEKHINADFIQETGIYGSFEDHKDKISAHGSKLLHNNPISTEMKNLGIIPTYE